MPEEKSSRHKHALALAEAGIPVFPVQVNGKKPRPGSNAVDDETLDPDRINAWWSEADYNIAMCPESAGWCVIDLDGEEGVQSWETLIKDHKVPETYTIETPSGGRHLYFQGSLPPTARGLGPKIDTRGRRSYVVVPPSVIDGQSYKVVNEADIAPLPQWVTDRINRPEEHHHKTVTEADLEAVHARARILLEGYVKAGDVAIEGRGGDNRTFQLTCELHNLGCTADMMLELLTEIWNPHCVPPWSDEELLIKIDNAEKYAQNEPGAWASAPPSETFRDFLDSPAAKQTMAEHSPKRSRFYAESEAEQEAGKEPTWLVKNLIPDLSTVLMVGMTGSYKSFLALELALSTVAGTATFGGASPSKNGLVFYAAAEGRHALKTARRRAWKIARGVDSVPGFYVMPTPLIALQDDIDEFVAEIDRRSSGEKIAVIVLDTVAKCMAGMDENNTGDMGRFVRFCDQLVERYQCIVLSLHHRSDKPNSAEMRGSSALRAGMDTVISVTAQRSTKAVSVRVVQHKDADEPERPWTLVGQKVGPSLVFFPTTETEHKALAATDDTFNPRNVGAALAKMGCYGWDDGVMSQVLATEMVGPKPEGVTDEAHHSLITKTARGLGSLSHTRLLGYCERRGRETRWFLPPPGSPDRPDTPEAPE